MDSPPNGRSLVRNISLTFVLLFLVLMLVIAVAWLVLNPHDPSFRVSLLSVSNFSVSDSQLRGTYDIGFNISNPNKKVEVSLDDFHVVVYYGSVMLYGGTAQPQPISLGRMKATNLKVEIEMKDDSPKLVKKKVLGKVGKDWRKGVVNFDVRMEVRIRFEDGNWPTKLKLLNLYCGDLDVGFFGPKDTGKLLGVGKDCQD